MRGAFSSIYRALKFTLTLTLTLTACTAEPGEPWARLRGLEVILNWEASPERAHPDGGWRTATSFRVYDLSLTIDYEELTLLGLDAAAPAAGSPITAIDPSAPPAGCTLCHGGHCHCGGELIDYAELLSRGATGSGDRGLSPILSVAEAWRGALYLTEDSEGDRDLDRFFLLCEGLSCDLGSGSLGGLSLRLPRVTLSFMVDDLLHGEGQRLIEPERVELELALPNALELLFEAPVELGQGSQPPDEHRALTLRLTHTLKPTLFDADWSQRSAELEFELLSTLSDQLELELFDH